MFGFAYLFTAMILFLKLISYAHANRDLRLAWREVARSAKERGGDDGEGPKMGLVGAATAVAGGRDGVSWTRELSGGGGGGGAGGRVRVGRIFDPLSVLVGFGSIRFGSVFGLVWFG